MASMLSIDELPLAAALSVPQWTIGLVIAAIGLGLLMPHASKAGRALGAGLAAIGVGVIFYALPWEAAILTKSLFYVLAAIALAAAVGAVSSRSAIYCAIWFAASLLGVAGLLTLAGAQFLGVATIVVYAGAIVVTFLFVIMLAQPKGNESYDRVSWGSLSKPVAIFAAAALVAASLFSQQQIAGGGLREEIAQVFSLVPESSAYPRVTAADVVAVENIQSDAGGSLEIALRPTIFPKIAKPGDVTEQPELDKRAGAQEMQKAALEKAFREAADEYGVKDFDAAKTAVVFKSGLPVQDTQTPRHVEALGVQLFGNQLIAVQVAGVLLLVALVGAISILAHDAPAAQRSEAAT